MKTFIHNELLTPVQMETITIDGNRYYLTPTGNKHKSVTTVIGNNKAKKQGIMEWRKRVGEEQANKISVAATTRGTKMHTLCEKYLLNEEVNDLGYSQGELLFRSIKPSLDEFETIRALETTLYSKRLQVAGTVDCVAEIGNVLTVVDFKTASKEKKKEWIEDYFLQGAFYLNAFYELSGEIPKSVKILIALETGGTQIFDLAGKEIIHYSKELEKRIEKYYANQTI